MEWDDDDLEWEPSFSVMQPSGEDADMAAGLRIMNRRSMSLSEEMRFWAPMSTPAALRSGPWRPTSVTRPPTP